MFAQVVAPSKALIAKQTGEFLFPRVGAHVTLQLVRASEALPAEEPVAHEGPLARVPAQVSLQVRGLAVDLSAAGNVAAVHRLLAQGCGGRPESLQLLAVWAVAGGSTRGGAARVPAGTSGRFESHGVIQDSRAGHRLGLVHVLREHVLRGLEQV